MILPGQVKFAMLFQSLTSYQSIRVIFRVEFRHVRICKSQCREWTGLQLAENLCHTSQELIREAAIDLRSKRFLNQFLLF